MRSGKREKATVAGLLISLIILSAFSGTAVAATQWSQIPGPTTGLIVYSQLYDNARNILYAGTDSGVWRCTQPYSSPSWTKICDSGNIGNTTNSGIAYDQARNLLYATAYNPGTPAVNGVWRCASPEGSFSWTKIGNAGGQKLFGITFDATRNILYMCTGTGGNVWQALNPSTAAPTWNSAGGAANCILYEPTSNKLYVGTQANGIMRMDNPGPTFTTPAWIPVTPAAPLNVYDCFSMAYDSANNILYGGLRDPAGPTPQGAWRCTNPMGTPGSGWTKISGAANVGGDLVLSLELDPVSNILYAGTNSNKGVFACTSPDSGPAWQQTGGAISNKKVEALLFNQDRGILFAGSQGSGAWYYMESAVSTWFLAEGSTAWGFSTYISIQNPNPFEVTAAITYMTSSGPVAGPNVLLPPASQATVSPSDTVGQADFSTRVVCGEGRIAVDRTMTWTGPGAASPEAHNSVGVTGADNEWFMPEGSSDWGFETWLLIQNPNSTAISCDVTYMIEGAGPQTFTKTIPANSRQSYNMADDIGAKDASIKVTSTNNFIPERAMYRNNRREGHDSIGTTAPAQDFYLAEGAVGYDSGYITYVLVQNPQNTTNKVTVTYLTGSGEVAGPTIDMPANSRKTIRVNDQLPPATDVSTHVHGDQPIIAERAMYWNSPAGEACHDSIGLDQSHTAFYLPDGETSNGRETWTLVQNPNPSNVTIEVTYMTPDGSGNKTFTDTVPANSRKTYNMSDQLSNSRAAIKVRCTTAGKSINVERAMYWNSRGAGTDTVGGYSD